MARKSKKDVVALSDRTVTIVDLAERLGVSATTVSRALREKGGMSEDTRERIKQAAAEYGYIPNKAGATLSTGRTFSIGYIVPRDERGFPSMLQADVMRGMVEELAHHGYSLSVYSEDYFRSRGIGLLDSASEIRADGLAVTIEHNDPVPAPASPLPYPLAVVNRQLDGIEADFILADEEHGGQLAIEHLLAQGHRRIAFVGGPLDHDALARRQKGYGTALEAAGIRIDPELIDHNSDFTWRGGYKSCNALLGRNPGGFSAIFCGSDLLAFGVLKCLEEKGFKVPQDIAVVSFDDVFFADLTDPALTTIRKPRYEMGRIAARQLISRITAGDAAPANVRLPVEIIVRASSLAEPAIAADPSRENLAN